MTELQEKRETLKRHIRLHAHGDDVDGNYRDFVQHNDDTIDNLSDAMMEQTWQLHTLLQKLNVRIECDNRRTKGYHYMCWQLNSNEVTLMSVDD
jgi:hypothetical protein